MSGEDLWVAFAVAWPEPRVARMDAALVRVRQWLVADGVSGVGTGGPEWTAARQRAIAGGLSHQEAWLVSEVLAVDAKRLAVPGARVQARARQAVTVTTHSLALRAGRPVTAPVTAPEAVQRYAVAEHAWQADDPVPVVEDLPWSLDVRADLRALPVAWLGVVTDPVMLGGDGADWHRYLWRFGRPRPTWADDPAARGRIMAATRAFGWRGMPLRADLDDVERYLPTTRWGRGQGEHVAWLVPGVAGVGWALAWRVGG